ncbi:nicotinate (nicotinamide) nucleotide adenylyltransferase [Oscillospiraceae bacterium PP1C4]
MRTGVFGGTFNPVHNGHIKLAQTYLCALQLDRLLVIPTHVPPHKTNAQLIDGAYRLEMCRLAFADTPVCQVSDIEVNRSYKSYTVDTLEQLKLQSPQDELYLIMGSDMFETLTEWYRWERIIELAVICAGAREPNLREKLELHLTKLEALGARCKLVELEPVVVSSTEVRERVRSGQEIRSLVPAAVADYIAQNKLYQ